MLLFRSARPASVLSLVLMNEECQFMFLVFRTTPKINFVFVRSEMSSFGSFGSNNLDRFDIAPRAKFSGSPFQF